MDSKELTIGKGQKQIQQTATTQSQEQYRTGVDAQNRLRNDPQLAARKALVEGRRGAINSGDLRNQKDFVSNAANVAERKRQRDMRANVMKGGVAGLASNYADPTQVALAEKAYSDEFERDSASQTHADLNQYMSETTAMETDLINHNAQIESGIMGTAFGTANNNLQLASQIAAQRASVLPGILGAAIGGASSMLTGSNWFNKK